MKSTTIGAFLFAAAAAAFAVTLAPSDSDMWWHLASGDWMLDHRAILDHDVFSYTRDGAPYGIGQWLGQILLALAFRAGSWVGVDVLRASLVAVSTFFMALATLRCQPHLGWAALPIAGTILVSKITWGDRPQLFTLALFPLVLVLLMCARLEGRTRLLALVPPLFLLWSNLHGAFVVGLALVAIFVAEAVVTRAPQGRALGATFVASLVATLVNPTGPGAIASAFSYASLPGGFIVEERPPDILTGAGFVFALLLIAALAAALALGRDGAQRRLRVPLLWPALVVPFAILALTIQRQMPLACAVLAPFVAAALPAALGRPPVASLDLPRRGAVTALAALALAVAASAALSAPREPDLSLYPAEALPALRGARGHLLNEYDWGGYLIRVAPEQKTFIDGRGAVLFVPDVLKDFQTAVQLRAGYREVLSRWDIAAVLLRPDRPLAGALREDGWSVRAEAPGRWILLERR